MWSKPTRPWCRNPRGRVCGPRSRIRKRHPDVITFTSSSTVKNFVALLGSPAKGPALLEGTTLASIGPVTSATLRDLGLGVDVEAKQFTIPGLVKAIVGSRM